ncbi:MAG: nucleotidyltransferase domain-containing protein [Synergistaceae bacterium]|nr:nucleotidyltransferase domain-containing protein [Synergistaceae bacterium]
MNLPDRVLSEIRTFAAEHGVLKVILFGSRASGTNTDRSDVDIAVSGGDFGAFYWDIQEKIHSLLMFDVIDIDSGISEALSDEILHGVVIYEKT